jgi:DNA-binding PadR family transcriptional regulator
MVTTKKIQEKLTKNLLIPIILDMLNDKPMCGYEIIQAIRESYGVNFSASTIYPVLTHLDGKKLVSNEWKIESRHPKKVYKLTQQGQNELNFSISYLNLICTNLDYTNETSEKNLQLRVIFE